MAFDGGRPLGIRLDPYVGCNFLVELDGLLAGGFSEVSGLEITTEVEKFREGGVNDHLIALPKGTSQAELVLKKGVTGLDVLWLWYMKTVAGRILRKNVSVLLMNESRMPVKWWDFAEAYPVKWVGPNLNAQQNAYAVESITLVHHGMSTQKGGLVLGKVAGIARMAGL